MNTEKLPEVIFSLDIGTRSVIGIVAQQKEDVFQVLDVEIMHHPDRNMYDGQIHDIEGVVKIVKEIKKKLEEKLTLPLKEVAIAAAGRALQTYRVQVDRLIDENKEIDRSLINNLEMEGLQLAQAMLDKDKKKSKYYCVGYTVVNYFLNDSPIGSLLGHKGGKIGADILATFLPHVVVDSLYTVMHRVGLEVVHLTLEPIAAINVAIPAKARLLNLALVDIGAGTSDIALTKDGTIIAYAMASVAGDEITEALAQQYLLDFDAAEKLKLNLCQNNQQIFTDIVGIEYNLSTEEILANLEAPIDNLASQIAQNILEYNQKAPSAVFLVGGGSQIPCLTKAIAEKLSLPPARVVVKGTEVLQDIQFSSEQKINGPEFITPIGIGVTAFKNNNENFLHVTVNGQKVKMFNAKQLTIADALLLIGYNARKLLTTRGPSLTFFLNGLEKTINGAYGEAGQIYLNGQVASLETKLNNEDDIVIEEAKPGTKAAIILPEILPQAATVQIGDKTVSLLQSITVNGQEIPSIDIEIAEGDKIEIYYLQTLEDLLSFLEQSIVDWDFSVNSLPVKLNYRLQDGDIITWQKKEQKISLAKNLLSTVTINVNNEQVSFQHDKKQLMFIDIFNYIKLDLSHVKGQVDLELNGQRASFTDPIKSGDNITISFSE